MDDLLRVVIGEEIIVLAHSVLHVYLGESGHDDIVALVGKSILLVLKYNGFSAVGTRLICEISMGSFYPLSDASGVKAVIALQLNNI